MIFVSKAHMKTLIILQSSDLATTAKSQMLEVGRTALDEQSQLPDGVERALDGQTAALADYAAQHAVALRQV